MQVFGLRSLASWIAAASLSNKAAIRRELVCRWRQAMREGLTAAQAVGASLFRWEKQPRPKSRRPLRLRRPARSPALVQAVEELSADNPMWGERKLAWLLRREGVVVSISTIAATCGTAWTAAWWHPSQLSGRRRAATASASGRPPDHLSRA